MNSPNLIAQASRIAIIKLSSLGDVLHASPCAEAIKHSRPEAFVAWVVDERFAGLLEGNSFIDELIVVPWRGGTWQRLKALVEAGKRLHKLQIELVIDLQGLFKSALVARYSKAPLKACAADAREGAKFVAKYYMNAPEGMGGAAKQLAYVASLGADSTGLDMRLEPTPWALEAAGKLLEQAGLPKGRPFVAIVPSTTRQTKLWPEWYFAELARLCKEQLGLSPVYLGTSKDKALADRIIAQSGVEGANLCGQTDLQQLVALGRLAALCIGGDTGPVFICAAAGAPTVAIFGSTAPAGKLPQGEKYKFLYKHLPCAPCNRTYCENLQCLLQIRPEEVLQTAREALAASAGNAPGSPR